jgi:signal transduction histidine kinase
VQVGREAGGRRRDGLAAHLGVATAIAAAGSLGATAVLVAAHEPGTYHRAGPWFAVEALGLLACTVVVLRWAPGRRAAVAAALAGVAVPASLLRFGEAGDSTEGLAGVGAWTSVAGLTACAGLYLRAVDARRARTVAAAREAQRLMLAQDLHDFVAHDVSGMLAQAQAGRVVGAHDPAAAMAALERIEASALHALSSMDRTIRLLRETGDGTDPPAPRTPVPTLTDLPELVERFDRPVDLRIDPAMPTISDELGSTAYRIVAEALTNVRRHAASATGVLIEARPADGDLELTIRDDGHDRSGTRGRRGGLGLTGLTERVEALGGTLRAGPLRPQGWQVRVRLPGLTGGPSR